ncbi:unnamed protein product [Boreogadus saida]
MDSADPKQANQGRFHLKPDSKMSYSTSKFSKAKISYSQADSREDEGMGGGGGGGGVLWTFCVQRHLWIHPEQDTTAQRFNSPALAAGSVTRPPRSELQANPASSCLAQSHLTDRLTIVRDPISLPRGRR